MTKYITAAWPSQPSPQSEKICVEEQLSSFWNVNKTISHHIWLVVLYWYIYIYWPLRNVSCDICVGRYEQTIVSPNKYSVCATSLSMHWSPHYTTAIATIISYNSYHLWLTVVKWESCSEKSINASSSGTRNRWLWWRIPSHRFIKEKCYVDFNLNLITSFCGSEAGGDTEWGIQSGSVCTLSVTVKGGTVWVLGGVCGMVLVGLNAEVIVGVCVCRGWWVIEITFS